MEAKTNSISLSKPTWIALFVSLALYPLLYCSGIMGQIIEPIFKEHSRLHWWYFWTINLLFHWIPFGIIYFALRKNNESFQSIGLELDFFRKKFWWFIALFALLVFFAFIIPKLIYDKFPPISNTIFIGPVSTPERLFVILGAFTAAFTEEIIFRGFAITRLSKIFKNPWIPLLISIVAFLFIHGVPRSIGMTTNYLIAGLAFGLAFIFMKMRRLEILIIIHFLIDASLVIAP